MPHLRRSTEVHSLWRRWAASVWPRALDINLKSGLSLCLCILGVSGWCSSPYLSKMDISMSEIQRERKRERERERERERGEIWRVPGVNNVRGCVADPCRYRVTGAFHRRSPATKAVLAGAVSPMESCAGKRSLYQDLNLSLSLAAYLHLTRRQSLQELVGCGGGG